MSGNQKIPEASFSEIISPFFSKWYIFLTSISVFFFLGLLYIYFDTPLYKVQAKVLIKETKKNMAGGADIAGIAGLSGFGDMGTNSIENELQVITSKNIAETIVEELQLQVTQFKKARYNKELFGEESPYEIKVLNEKPFAKFPKKPIKISQKGDVVYLESEELGRVETPFGRIVSLPYANIILIKNKNYNPALIEKTDLPLTELYFSMIPRELAIENLQESLKVFLADEQGTVLQLELVYSNIRKAKEIINNIIRVYNIDAQEDKNKDDQKSKDFIDERLNIIAKELGEVESKKEKFKVDNRIVDLSGQARIDMHTNLQSKERLLDMETQLELNNMMLSYLDKNNYQLLPSSIGVENPAAASILKSYNQLVSQRNTLLENATPKNPLVIELTNQIDDLNKALKESIKKNRTGLELAKNKIIQQESKSEKGMDLFPQREKSYRGIERQQQIKENLYLLLLEKREEASIKLAMTADKARVIDGAYSSIKPVSPKKIVIIACCFILGLLVPFLYILIKMVVNNKVVTKSDIERLTSIPIISEIPRNKKGKTQVIKTNEMSPSAEAFRILANNLKFILPKQIKANRVIVTSSVKGEGKTYIAINTALSLVSFGKKVLLIGADIRNPQLQRYDESKKNVKGLTEYLYGEIEDVKELIHPSGLHDNCEFIYSGTIPPNPVELLSNGKMGEILDSVSSLYDYILIDAAPMMPVSDTSILAEYAEATIYILRSEYSDKKFIEFLNNIEKQGKIKKVVTVLNDVHRTNYGYGNVYGYGYEK